MRVVEAHMATIRQVKNGEPQLMAGLCTLLIDAVQGGASVGFLSPLSVSSAESYWREVFAKLNAGLVLWVADYQGEICGSVQLSLCQKENGTHRAEVQKLFVLRTRRECGVGTQLMQAVESYAQGIGRSLLVLDTMAGSSAELFYRHRGWEKVGEIPAYAAFPDGTLGSTAIHFKRFTL